MPVYLQTTSAPGFDPLLIERARNATSSCGLELTLLDDEIPQVAPHKDHRMHRSRGLRRRRRPPAVGS